MNYMLFLQEGLRYCTKLILKDIEKSGVKAGKSIFITFDTHNNLIELPKYLKDQYPKKMTIVLENDYYDLEVEDDSFSVTLFFDAKEERIKIPFNLIYRIEDPSDTFILEFNVDLKSNLKEDNIIKLDFTKS